MQPSDQSVNQLVTTFVELGCNGQENIHKQVVGIVEESLIKAMLKRTFWNQVRTASLLGINRNTLRKKMKMYNIPFKPAI